MKTYGPYLRKDGRKHAIIIHDDGSRQTRSWPRILMEQKLNRGLLDEETVDHIDNDFTNDSFDNLQLLTRKENVEKSIVKAKYITLICKTCNTSFERREVIYNYNKNIRKKDGPFCSHRCVGKFHN